eukprot:GFYU01016365.1.p2 GENE.GFYU01016365.1~~GFYU01016365.1.p2  ORF type:complete len:103 (-),score=22.75 GFYU01016365.1:70-378(-)
MSRFAVFTQASTAVGRSWKASELRQHSFDDLHKLWWVLLREKNVLMTELDSAKSAGVPMEGRDRIRKVRKSMSRIKAVLGERERAAVATGTAPSTEMTTEEK